MIWTNAGVISPSRNWQYTNVVEGEFFRLSHNYSDLPTEYFQAELTQIEEGEDGAITTFGYHVIEASPTSEVIQLTKPECFSNRKIAIRQLSRDVDLPPAGRVYSWAIGVEVFDPNATPPPPPPPETPSAAGVVYTASQSSSYQNNPEFVGTYANLTDSSELTGANAQSGAQWIKATFPSIVRVTAVTVGGGYLGSFGGATFGLNGAEIQYSIDNDTWITVATISGVTDAGENRLKTFTLNTPIEAQHWRLWKGNYVATTHLVFE